MLVDGRRVRAMLSMASGYIYSQLCEISRTLLMALIPHRYVRGKHHGKIEGHYLRWDMRLDADGQNGVLEELKRRVWNYEKERFDALLTQWDTTGPLGVYFVHNPKPLDGDIHIAFSNKEALRSVRFRSFVQDCHRIERSSQELEAVVCVERTRLERFIVEQHVDVLKTCHTKVVQFHGKRRILLKNGQST